MFIKKIKWTIYIIETHSGKYYTGVTTDIERRFTEHLSSKKGAKFFNTSLPKRIVYVEHAPNRSMAQMREATIKKMNRTQKKVLINLNREKKIESVN